MTGLSHTLTGITIAITIQHPVLAPLFALLSHFLLDMLPHFGGVAWYDEWGKKLITLTFFDASLCVTSVALAVLLLPNLSLVILTCAFAAVLPDLFWILHYKFEAKHWYFDFHQKIQRYERPWGAFIELAFCVISLAFLFNR